MQSHKFQERFNQEASEITQLLAKCEDLEQALSLNQRETKSISDEAASLL